MIEVASIVKLAPSQRVKRCQDSLVAHDLEADSVNERMRVFITPPQPAESRLQCSGRHEPTRARSWHRQVSLSVDRVVDIAGINIDGPDQFRKRISVSC